MHLFPKRLTNILIWIALIIPCKSLLADPTATTKLPNIVLVLADDMNWFDIGAYHRMFDYAPKNAITPNIDILAKEGMLFTLSLIHI